MYVMIIVIFMDKAYHLYCLNECLMKFQVKYQDQIYIVFRIMNNTDLKKITNIIF